MSKVVYAKNKEIGDLFNNNNVLKQELSEERDLNDMVQQEAQSLKQQILSLNDEKDELIMQNEIMQDEINEKSKEF